MYSICIMGLMCVHAFQCVWVVKTWCVESVVSDGWRTRLLACRRWMMWTHYTHAYIVCPDTRVNRTYVQCMRTLWHRRQLTAWLVDYWKHDACMRVGNMNSSHAHFTDVSTISYRVTGTCHAEELQFLFPLGRDLFISAVPTAADTHMRKALVAMWANFARTG